MDFSVLLLGVDSLPLGAEWTSMAFARGGTCSLLIGGRLAAFGRLGDFSVVSIGETYVARLAHVDSAYSAKNETSETR